jgi:hypothetical protein
MRACIGG